MKQLLYFLFSAGGRGNGLPLHGHPPPPKSVYAAYTMIIIAISIAIVTVVCKYMYNEYVDDANIHTYKSTVIFLYE